MARTGGELERRVDPEQIHCPLPALLHIALFSGITGNEFPLCNDCSMHGHFHPSAICMGERGSLLELCITILECSFLIKMVMPFFYSLLLQLEYHPSHLSHATGRKTLLKPFLTPLFLYPLP